MAQGETRLLPFRSVSPGGAVLCFLGDLFIHVLYPNVHGPTFPLIPHILIFILSYKENTDTMDAINVISGNLGLKTGGFVFSGTKDKRGMTTQRVSVQKVNAHRLLSLNDKLKCIKIGNCEYKKNSLRMGDNWGNQFRIVLRSLKLEEREKVAVALQSLAENGFINYYGMQVGFVYFLIISHDQSVLVIQSPDYLKMMPFLFSVSGRRKCQRTPLVWRYFDVNGRKPST